MILIVTLRDGRVETYDYEQEYRISDVCSVWNNGELIIFDGPITNLQLPKIVTIYNQLDWSKVGYKI